MNIERFRKLLLAEQTRLETQRRLIRGMDESGSQQEETSELSDYDQHAADTASETFEREKDLGIEEALRTTLAQIEEALQRLDAGTYGICDRCRKPIAPRRLEAIPYATLCIDCANLVGGGT